MMFKTNKSNLPMEEKKIPLKFDISMLNMIVGCLFKKSVQLNRRSLTNMKKLFDKIDPRAYEGNEKLESRFEFINKALEARLDKGFENEDAIINYCRKDVFDGNNEEIIESIPSYIKLNYEEIKYINKAIEDRLQYYYLFNYKDLIYDTVEKLDSGEYKSFGDINSQLVNICAKLLNEVRKSKNIENTDSFIFSDENFDNNIIDTVEKIKNPSRELKTGIQMLNHILSPAFMAGRLYVIMGLPGLVKSQASS